LNLNIRTLDKIPEIDNYLTVRNCYKSTRVWSKSTSIGIFDWVSRLSEGISLLSDIWYRYASLWKPLLVDLLNRIVD